MATNKTTPAELVNEIQHQIGASTPFITPNSPVIVIEVNPDRLCYLILNFTRYNQFSHVWTEPIDNWQIEDTALSPEDLQALRDMLLNSVNEEFISGNVAGFCIGKFAETPGVLDTLSDIFQLQFEALK